MRVHLKLMNSSSFQIHDLNLTAGFVGYIALVWITMLFWSPFLFYLIYNNDIVSLFFSPYSSFSTQTLGFFSLLTCSTSVFSSLSLSIL